MVPGVLVRSASPNTSCQAKMQVDDCELSAARKTASCTSGLHSLVGGWNALSSGQVRQGVSRSQSGAVSHQPRSVERFTRSGQRLPQRADRQVGSRGSRAREGSALAAA